MRSHRCCALRAASCVTLPLRVSEMLLIVMPIAPARQPQTRFCCLPSVHCAAVAALGLFPQAPLVFLSWLAAELPPPLALVPSILTTQHLPLLCASPDLRSAFLRDPASSQFRLAKPPSHSISGVAHYLRQQARQPALFRAQRLRPRRMSYGVRPAAFSLRPRRVGCGAGCGIDPQG